MLYQPPPYPAFLWLVVSGYCYLSTFAFVIHGFTELSCGRFCVETLNRLFKSCLLLHITGSISFLCNQERSWVKGAGGGVCMCASILFYVTLPFFLKVVFILYAFSMPHSEISQDKKSRLYYRCMLFHRCSFQNENTPLKTGEISNIA